MSELQQITFREVVQADLPILIEIENLGFTPEEAATPDAFQTRIKMIPDTFIVAESNGEVLGYVDGPVVHKRYITDDLFATVVPNAPVGGHQAVLGLAVRPEHRKSGIGSALIQELIRRCTLAQRETITLTCRDMLIPFYERNGFKNEGKSESDHGGYVWYNMVYSLQTSDQVVSNPTE